MARRARGVGNRTDIEFPIFMGPLPLDPTDRDTPISERAYQSAMSRVERELCVSQKQLGQQSTTFSFSIGARGVLSMNRTIWESFQL